MGLLYKARAFFIYVARALFLSSDYLFKFIKLFVDFFFFFFDIISQRQLEMSDLLSNIKDKTDKEK